MDADKIPTLERLAAAADVLSWLGNRASLLPDDQPNGVTMGLQLTLAASYLVEYQRHLVDGMEPYDALLATARGELRLT
ncbi:hypothetical protein HLB44_25430 [Aquincola sp. S2]|uniref:Uncharacterized protein n=1 Tax=Pseudaquabacterium terrae TaxID=2732868 RepID=A0ABX2ENY4_9BURK|nr:hypothetical protein [Aquabacterium terrae]NRF70356.1 hypothetical protein [Aquabacterium terrae]